MKCTNPPVYLATFGKIPGINVGSVEDSPGAPSVVERPAEALELHAHEVLWQVAGEQTGQAESFGNAAIAEHLNECAHCRAILESFRKLRSPLEARYLRATPDGALTVLAVCPSSAHLDRYANRELPAPHHAAIETHLAQCADCAQDAAFLLRTQVSHVVTMPMRRRWIGLAAACAALLMLIPMIRETRKSEVRLAALAVQPPLDRAELLRMSLREEQTGLQQFLTAYDANDAARSEQIARRMMAKSNGPVSSFLVGMALYKEGKIQAAYDAVYVSEKTQPMSAYRCWCLLQLALMNGKRDIALRECGHVSHHANYAKSSDRLQSEIQKIS